MHLNLCFYLFNFCFASHVKCQSITTQLTAVAALHGKPIGAGSEVVVVCAAYIHTYVRGKRLKSDIQNFIYYALQGNCARIKHLYQKSNKICTCVY